MTDVLLVCYEALMFVLQTEGLPGFLRGVVPRTLRRTLMAALAWTVYEQVRLRSVNPSYLCRCYVYDYVLIPGYDPCVPNKWYAKFLKLVKCEQGMSWLM